RMYAISLLLPLAGFTEMCRLSIQHLILLYVQYFLGWTRKKCGHSRRDVIEFAQRQEVAMRKTLATLVSAALLTAAACFSQTEFGAIVGNVTDPSSAG